MELLHRSLAGAVLVLVILIIRAVAVNRLPKAAFMALWAVAAARLLLPFSVPSRFSLYNLVEGLKENGAKSPRESLAFGTKLPGGGTQGLYADTGGIFGADIVSVVEVLYVLGVCVFGICFLVSYCSGQKKFRTSLPVRHKAVEAWLAEKNDQKSEIWPDGKKRGKYRRIPQVRVSDQILSPLTYGILHPVILLPKKLDWEDEKTLCYVLGHEYVHILHFDAFHKMVLAVMLCVHWFNPLVWVMYFFANRDMELYCDEAVVRMGGEEKKESYALALLRMEELKRVPFSLHSHFSNHAMEERIVAIMKMKKNSVFGFAFAAVLVAGTATLFATSAFAGEKDEPGSWPVEPGKEGMAGGQDGALPGTGVTPTPIYSKTVGMDANETGQLHDLYIIGSDEMDSDLWDELFGNLQSGGSVCMAVTPTPVPGVADGVDANDTELPGQDTSAEQDYYLDVPQGAGGSYESTKIEYVPAEGKRWEIIDTELPGQDTSAEQDYYLDVPQGAGGSYKSTEIEYVPAKEK